MSCIRENDLAVAVRGLIFGLLPVAMELMQPTVNAASHHVEVFTMYFILLATESIKRIAVRMM